MRSADPYDAILEGLAEGVQHGRGELAELVEEERPAVYNGALIYLE